MEMENEEAAAARNRGAGGKHKKPKRQFPSPYSRPQPWLSKLAVPVRHLITGFPSLVAKFRPEFEPPQFHEQHQPRGTNSRIEDSVPLVTKPTEIEEPRQRVSKFTDISQLVSQRTFSREEAERLINVLNSKQVESPPKNHEPAVASTNHNTNGSASPVDIAKAFMKNRSSEASVASHRSPPSRSPDTTTRWPGVLSQHDVETPIKRTPIVGHIFERTPYSRYKYLKKETIAPQRNETRFGSGSSGPDRRIERAESSSLYEQSSRSVGVPAHSSHLARRILEHLDRNPPTPKEKFDELKFAVSADHMSPDKFRVGHLNPVSVDFQEEVKKGPSEKTPVTGNKRMLPPISVGFTFPVAMASDLPTPSMAPSLKCVPNVDSVPISYEFGTDPSRVDFSFAGVSHSPDFDSMNLKFSFGSNRSSNVSFSFPNVTVSS